MTHFVSQTVRQNSELENRKTLQRIIGAVLLLTITGCAVQSSDDVAVISQQIQSVSTQPLQQDISPAEQQLAAARVRELLQQRLSVSQAVELAILNNPEIQAELWSLGIAQSDLRQLSSLPNPGLKITRSLGGESNTEVEFGFNLLSLLTLPAMRDLATQDFMLTRISVAQRIAQLIHETKLAYWQAVAAGEVLAFVEKVHSGTEASAELARRMAQTGNFNKLKFLREQSFLSDSSLNLLAARHSVHSSNEKLKRQLGLWQADAIVQLPERLPEVPKDRPAIAPIAQQSLDQRLDVQLVKLQLQRLADQADLIGATRLVNVFAAEVSTNLQHSDERSFSLIFELPIFDAGQHRVSKIAAQYQQAFAQATAVGIKASSELRQSFYNYKLQHDIALHYQQTVLPLQQQIAEENQLLYNGMFISVFDLLADARNQISAVTSAIQANRDFWLTRAELEMTMVGTPGVTIMTPALQQAASKPAAH